MSRPQARLARLEARARETAFRQAAERMAAAHDLDADAVLAEMRALAARRAALTARHGSVDGARRFDEQVAAEMGLSVPAMRAALARLEEATT